MGGDSPRGPGQPRRLAPEGPERSGGAEARARGASEGLSRHRAGSIRGAARPAPEKEHLPPDLPARRRRHSRSIGSACVSDRRPHGPEQGPQCRALVRFTRARRPLEQRVDAKTGKAEADGRPGRCGQLLECQTAPSEPGLQSTPGIEEPLTLMEASGQAFAAA